MTRGPHVETCLACLVAWDTDYDPPKCSEPDHPHALAVVAEWSVPCHGLISETADTGETHQ